LYFDKNYLIATILMRNHYTQMILLIMTTSNKPEIYLGTTH
jgi:hypothetical protein